MRGGHVKTIVIEVDVETEVSGERIQPLLQQYLEQHPIIDKLSFPVFVATNERMRAKAVRVTVRPSP
jgi:hypothetical protein